MDRRAVALIIYEGVQALDVAGPLDVFAEANAVLPPEETYCVLLAATSDGAGHQDDEHDLGEDVLANCTC